MEFAVRAVGSLFGWTIWPCNVALRQAVGGQLRHRCSSFGLTAIILPYTPRSAISLIVIRRTVSPETLNRMHAPGNDTRGSQYSALLFHGRRCFRKILFLLTIALLRRSTPCKQFRRTVVPKAPVALLCMSPGGRGVLSRFPPRRARIGHPRRSSLLGCSRQTPRLRQARLSRGLRSFCRVC